MRIFDWPFSIFNNFFARQTNITNIESKSPTDPSFSIPAYCTSNIQCRRKLECRFFVIDSLERVFRCLTEIIIVYGEEVIVTKIFSFTNDHLNGSVSLQSSRRLSSLLAALHVLQLSVALMTDPFLVKNLNTLNIFLIKSMNIFLSPNSDLIGRNDAPRFLMASSWIKILVEICERVGREMILSYLMKTIFALFSNLENFYMRSSTSPKIASSFEMSPQKKTLSSDSSCLSEDFYTDVAVSQESIKFGTPQRYSALVNANVR